MRHFSLSFQSSGAIISAEKQREKAAVFLDSIRCQANSFDGAVVHDKL